MELTVTSIMTPEIQCCLFPLQVMFGTTDGQVIVMSASGAMVSQTKVSPGNEITCMVWSCEKFNLEEQETCPSSSSSEQQNSLKEGKKSCYLCNLNLFYVSLVHVYMVCNHLQCVCWCFAWKFWASGLFLSKYGLNALIDSYRLSDWYVHQ